MMARMPGRARWWWDCSHRRDDDGRAIISAAMPPIFLTLFLLLLACVVISFIVVGVPGVVSHAQDVKGRKFFGLNLASRQDAERMQGDASISVELQFGYPILSGDQLQQYAMASALSSPSALRQETKTFGRG